MAKSDQERINAAEKFATEKHKGQTRIGGDPYISHPIAVAQIIKEQGYGTDYQITALFHDLLEDTDASDETLTFVSDKAGAYALVYKDAAIPVETPVTEEPVVQTLPVIPAE